MADTFKALMMREIEDGKVAAVIEDVPVADLPEGEVEVRIEHSTLNYKDGLVVDGNKGRLARKFPHIPGIDLAGDDVPDEDLTMDACEAVCLLCFRRHAVMMKMMKLCGRSKTMTVTCSATTKSKLITAAMPSHEQ